MFALDQVFTDLFRLRRRAAKDRRGATARVVAVFHPEDLHADQVALFDRAPGRTDVGILAALAGGDDHELEVFRAAGEDPGDESAGEFHLGRAGAGAAQRRADRPVGDFAELAEELDLGAALNRAELVEDAVRRGDGRAREASLERRKIPGRKILQLETQAAALQAQLDQ